ncbi:hypothetical protein ABDD95_20835 [Mucilaginibacter sp. PAMB04274]|uniref:hypothetical protein n=1 Tax=Mucilaginibacter sp. PAMB04274 TaxID=3138568 RepID=UPI0031F69CB8
MAQYCYFKYYQVKLHDTVIIPVSVNNFRRLPELPSGAAIQLLSKNERYVGYCTLIEALEKAKAGALAYLEQLADDGKEQEILDYRIAHYEDLNMNLVDRNIRKVEHALAIDPNYQWQPYHIKLLKSL